MRSKCQTERSIFQIAKCIPASKPLLEGPYTYNNSSVELKLKHMNKEKNKNIRKPTRRTVILTSISITF